VSYIPHNRRSIRLRGYDYTQCGAYFVTICAYQRLCLFGHIENDRVYLNRWGWIVVAEWNRTVYVRPNIILDAFVVMPNHMHGIIVITQPPKSNNHTSVGASDNAANDAVRRGLVHQTPTDVTPKPEFGKPQKGSLGTIIGAFKASVTRRINRLPQPPDHPIWQRNYYDRIIRDERELNHIRQYIALNPSRWTDDRFYEGES
jgi:putative transposase